MKKVLWENRSVIIEIDYLDFTACWRRGIMVDTYILIGRGNIGHFKEAGF